VTGTANVHDGHTGRFLYRTDGEHPPAQAPVVRVTPFDPDHTWRFMIAGDRIVPLREPEDALGTRDRARVTVAAHALRDAGLTFVLLVMSRSGRGVLRVVAVDPLPSLSHYHDHEDQVHEALLEWVAP
jgi:hypothetical protein